MTIGADLSRLVADYAEFHDITDDDARSIIADAMLTDLPDTHIISRVGRSDGTSLYRFANGAEVAI